MKKMLIVMAIAVVASMANAASFKWSAANLYGSDGTTKWSGDVVLHCAEIASFSQTTTATSGAIKAANTEFSDSAFVAGTEYNFYLTITDGGKTFTSASVTAVAQASDVAGITFGNMASQTQSGSNWGGGGQGGGDGPEPTSGLLLLVGAGILGLRRKRA